MIPMEVIDPFCLTFQSWWSSRFYNVIVRTLALGPHVSKARKPQAPPIVPLEVSDNSDTNSGTCSSADTSFTGDAFSKRHSGTQKEVQSLATSESDRATQEVPITSALALVTSSTPISSAISSQRAIPLANIVDPL
ncbi:hypothetical protein GH714_027656 [Hevea brasiliensis]|uniref:Uncharacterized protein n=1 Tax=Hevea brasiliensis TaxID=3981 RepID=A0A6A6LDX4_HEVBR|nr:hypothetical protein GH714_027656 [Hevea brasiliensis]